MYRIRMSGIDETCIVQKRWLWFFWYTPAEFTYEYFSAVRPVEYKSFKEARDAVIYQIRKEQYRYFSIE